MLNRKIGRNDPCPCGSGKKYKQCCQRLHGGNPVAAPSAGMSAPDFIQDALAHYQAGHLAQAEAICQRMLQISPNHPDGLHLAGMIAGQRGKHEKAVELIGKAISIKPSCTMYYNLGSALQDLRRFDAAVESYRKALALKPDFAEAYCNLGLALKDQGKLNAAIESYRKALALKPDFAEAHCNLGLVLQDQGKLNAAVGSYARALVIRPDFDRVYFFLGNTFNDLGRFEEAVACYRKLLELKPDDVEARRGLATVLRNQGKLDEAIESLDEALALKPDFPDAYIILATVYFDLGRFEAAHDALSKALEYDPENLGAWAALAQSRKMTLADGAWLDTAFRLLSKPILPVESTIGLHFAIGKYYDDTAQYDLAFPAYQKANALRRRFRGEVFDRADFSRSIDTPIAAYTADAIERQWEGASQSQLPVLVVGMPRSGTSLIEQIIASHPAAVGAGELGFWGAQASAHQAALLSGNTEAGRVAGIASEYEQLLHQYSAEAIRVVDKMSGNFLYLGFIHAIFPNARIIHAQRNPLDTCLSIYFQNFLPQHLYATDIEDIAHYYREYDRLMRHWRAVLPADRLLEVPYESLIEDTATWSRKIIEFVGLDWDERCLEFYKTERKVVTASNWQVRQKIYKTSKARWRHYEKYLGPLLDLLELNPENAQQS